MKTKLIISIFTICIISFSYNSYANEYFYCSYTNTDGTGQDYSKWGKETDFKYNKVKNRWEWDSKYSLQIIFPDGRYKQFAKVSYFDNQTGECSPRIEKIYKKRLSEILKRHK